MSAFEFADAFEALVKRDLDAIRHASQSPSAMASRDQRGQTPLHWAVRLRQVEAVRVLVAGALADLNAQDQWGNTALHYAVRHEPEAEIATELLINGANPMHPNAAGETPAFEALSLGKRPVFEQLAALADLDAPANARGETLRQCVQRQRPEWGNLLAPRTLGEAAVLHRGTVAGPLEASVAPERRVFRPR